MRLGEAVKEVSLLNKRFKKVCLALQPEISVGGNLTTTKKTEEEYASFISARLQQLFALVERRNELRIAISLAIGTMTATVENETIPLAQVLDDRNRAAQNLDICKILHRKINRVIREIDEHNDRVVEDQGRLLEQLYARRATPPFSVEASSVADTHRTHNLATLIDPLDIRVALREFESTAAIHSRESATAWQTALDDLEIRNNQGASLSS